MTLRKWQIAFKMPTCRWPHIRWHAAIRLSIIICWLSVDYTKSDGQQHLFSHLCFNIQAQIFRHASDLTVIPVKVNEKERNKERNKEGKETDSDSGLESTTWQMACHALTNWDIRQLSGWIRVLTCKAELPGIQPKQIPSGHVQWRVWQAWNAWHGLRPDSQTLTQVKVNEIKREN